MTLTVRRASESFSLHAPGSRHQFCQRRISAHSSGFVYVVDPHLKTYTYQYNLSVQRQVFHNTAFEASYVGSNSHGLTGLQDINPFILGTTDRALNLTPGNTTCQDDSGNSTSGASSDSVCSFGSLPEFRNVTKASYNSLQVSLMRQVADTPGLGRTYFTFAYTLAHTYDSRIIQFALRLSF